MTNHIDCNHCGWCCQRTPCSLAVFMGNPLKGPCGFLVDQEDGTFLCSLVMKETDEVRKMAVKQLILSGEGCSHKFGPHPLSLLKMLLQKGLQVGSGHWQLAKTSTRREMLQFAKESTDPQSILEALREFELFCEQRELAV